MVAYADILEPEALEARSPFGSTVAVAEGLSLVSRVGSAEQGKATFTGYVADNETSLSYARARMYSPGLGEFISRDPVGYFLSPDDFTALQIGYVSSRGDNPMTVFLGMSMYLYVGGNPGDSTDPTGMWPGWWDQMRRDASDRTADALGLDREKHWEGVEGIYNGQVQGTVKPLTAVALAGVAGSWETANYAVGALYVDPGEGSESPQAGVNPPDTPATDGKGKIHGEIPSRVPDSWSRDEIENAIDEMEKSRQEREKVTRETDKPDNKHGHRNREQLERTFLRKLREALKSRMRCPGRLR